MENIQFRELTKEEAENLFGAGDGEDDCYFNSMGEFCCKECDWDPVTGTVTCREVCY